MIRFLLNQLYFAVDFYFEQKLDNVSSAIKEMNIGYPVALDNRYEIWRSFSNEYWPALYLIDAKGVIRYQKFGEGDYAESESQIQKLLREVTTKNISTTPIALNPDGFEAAPDWRPLASPENFLGYSRTDGFASPGGRKRQTCTLFYTTTSRTKPMGAFRGVDHGKGKCLPK